MNNIMCSELHDLTCLNNLISCINKTHANCVMSLRKFLQLNLEKKFVYNKNNLNKCLK